MSRSIWKYPLAVVDHQTIDMPTGARVLSVHEQHGQLCMWAEVNANPDGPTETRHVRIKGTGHPIEQGEMIGFKFLGTVLVAGGSLVWHVYVR